MAVLIYGVTAFSLAFFIHFIIWKISLPKKNQTLVLLKIFFGVFIAVVMILKNTPKLVLFGIMPPEGFFSYLDFFLLYIFLTLAYICSYSAMEVDSPSLTIVLNIIRVYPDGLKRNRLYDIITDELTVKTRIRDLVKDKMVYMDADKYKLTSKGFFLANIFVFFRKLLNLPKGG